MERQIRWAFVIGVVSLVACALVGGAALSWAEGTSFVHGLWLSFSVVSTAGFEAPVTGLGKSFVSAIFAWTLASYVTLLTGVVARGRVLAAQQSTRSSMATVAEEDIRRVVASMSPN
ncbi:MAG: hypothetical protein KG028_02020 [Actinobacteria bacterium]|jgi:hypothetical protein|nr:hypothetical protein [Actinomycetota bacterium]